MKSASELLAGNGSHETWTPLLEVAAQRNVDERPLTRRKFNRGGAHAGSYRHGGISRAVVRRAQRAL